MPSKKAALLSAIALFTYPATAFAQDVTGGSAAPTDNAPAAAGDGGLQDIVVTAQKTGAASLQRVPIAMTAVTGETLANSNAVSVIDVGKLVPNAELQPGPRGGYANFTIRGIGLNGTVRSIDPAISLVQDGMVIAYPVLTLIDTFDVDTVEVLRGPQGILFGRNATGGAVSIRSERPDDRFRINAEATYGNFGRFDQSLAVGGPVAQNLFAKIAVLHRKNNGFFKDKNSGIFVPAPNNPSGVDASTQNDQVHIDNWLVRPTVVFKPSDTVDMTLIGEYTSVDAGGIAFQLATPNPMLTNQFGYTPVLGKFEINNGFAGTEEPSTRGKAYRLTGEVNIDLGMATLTSITGWRKVRIREHLDGDATPFTYLIVEPGTRDRSTQFSEELRLVSDLNDRLRLLVGGFYLHMTIFSADQRTLSTLTPASPIGPGGFRRIQALFDQKADAAAGFANIDWRATDRLRLSVGGRYSWEKKEAETVPFQVCTAPDFSNCPTPTTRGKKSWDNFSPRVTVDYEVADDVMLYGSWTNGFRSGNFNSRANSVIEAAPVDPETAEAFEVGFKSTFWDRRARFNVALFRTKYDDIQRTIQGLNITQVLANAAKATIKGFEVEAALRPVEGLQLDGSVGYTDAQYDEFQGLDLNGDRIPDPELAKNLKFDRVPKWTAHGSATYTHELGATGIGTIARIAYAYRSGYFLENNNRANAHQGGYGLLDASLGFEKNNVRVTFFGRNLTNARAKEFVLILPYGPAFSFGDPRTYGVTLGFKY